MLMGSSRTNPTIYIKLFNLEDLWDLYQDNIVCRKTHVNNFNPREFIIDKQSTLQLSHD